MEKSTGHTTPAEITAASYLQTRYGDNPAITPMGVAHGTGIQGVLLCQEHTCAQPPGGIQAFQAFQSAIRFLSWQEGHVMQTCLLGGTRHTGQCGVNFSNNQ